MKYVLEYRPPHANDWKKSRNAREEYDSLGELLQAIKGNESNEITSEGDYRIRKIPEQPEEQVLE